MAVADALLSAINITKGYTNIRARKAGGLWRHEFATYCDKLTIHFHMRLFCNVTDRLFIIRVWKLDTTVGHNERLNYRFMSLFGV